MISIRLLFLFLGLFKFSPPALAADFSSEMDHIASVCKGLKCKEPYSKKELFRFTDDPAKFALFDKLADVAFERAQVWGDTILEGDYEADGHNRLDRAVAVYKKQKLVAYWITYSEGAWDTSDCSYNDYDYLTLADCKTGRITESVYVAPDFTDLYIDEEDYAQFK